MKPASATPIGSLRLAEFFAETDLPKGMYQVLPVSSKVADGMARDDRFRKISFTGLGRDRLVPEGPRPEEARDARARRQRRRDRALRRRPRPRRAAGRVRRLLPGRTELHQRPAGARASEVYDDFAARLVKQVESLKVGRPDGPDRRRRTGDRRSEVDRIDEWVDEAVSQGAEVLTGGDGDGPFYEPTLLSPTYARR